MKVIVRHKKNTQRQNESEIVFEKAKGEIVLEILENEGFKLVLFGEIYSSYIFCHQ